MNLEDEVRQALKREPAPPGFAERVLARTRPPHSMRRTSILALAAAVALAAIVPPAVHQYRQRQRALEARDHLLAALTITRAQLRLTKEKIRRNTRNRL